MALQTMAAVRNPPPRMLAANETLYSLGHWITAFIEHTIEETAITSASYFLWQDGILTQTIMDSNQIRETRWSLGQLWINQKILKIFLTL